MSICWKPGWCECPECGPLEQSVSDYLNRLQSMTTDPVLLDRIDALRTRVTPPGSGHA
jgi:hypothetical protein